MIHTLKTAPAVEPITLAQMRQYLGINDATTTDRDAVITQRIATARQVAESYTKRALIIQTWRAVGDGFADVIPLVGPLQSVTSIKYTDGDGVQQTIASTDYYVLPLRNAVTTSYSHSWPAVRADVEPVIIEYVAGYGIAASAVPLAIYEAIALIVLTWEKYQTSLDGMVGYPPDLPRAAKSLLDPFIDYRDVIRA